MGRILGARKPVKRLQNRRFWSWFLQQKRKARLLLQPCLTNMIGWFKFDTVNNSGQTELVNSVEDGENILVFGVSSTWDGVEYLSVPHLVGDETVVDSDGTSTPSISAGRIDFTAGNCSLLELSNGDIFVMQSKNAYDQRVAYNIGNIGNDAYYSSTDISTKCGMSYLAENGFSIDEYGAIDLVINKDFPVVEVV